MLKSTFKITQMTTDLDNGHWSQDMWTPVDTFVIRADQLARGDHLCWSPQWTRVNFATLFGTRIQVSTRDYGMLIIPGGLMVVVSRG
jgi:hypothetical protein